MRIVYFADVLEVVVRRWWRRRRRARARRKLTPLQEWHRRAWAIELAKRYR